MTPISYARHRFPPELHRRPPRLHPKLAELYRKKVQALHEALHDPATQAEALVIVRSLIDQVIVRPATCGGVEDRVDGRGCVDPERKNAAR